MTATVHTHAPAPAHAHYTTTGLDNRKVGIWTFIGSVGPFFATLISTYLLHKQTWLTGPGPFPHEEWVSPAGQHFEPIIEIPLVTLGSALLLFSSLLSFFRSRWSRAAARSLTYIGKYPAPLMSVFTRMSALAGFLLAPATNRWLNRPVIWFTQNPVNGLVPSPSGSVMSVLS